MFATGKVFAEMNGFDNTPLALQILIALVFPTVREYRRIRLVGKCNNSNNNYMNKSVTSVIAILINLTMIMIAVTTKTKTTTFTRCL